MELTVILFLSSTLLFSYGMEIVAQKTKIPSILLLLLAGVIVRIILNDEQEKQVDVLGIISVVGTLGLILIVFEGGLELEYKREKSMDIFSAFYSALVSFVLLMAIIGLGIYVCSDTSLKVAFVNAIPICITSSAIAIPVAKFLSSGKREFIVYESVFSDVIGLIFFNYTLKYEKMEASIFWSIGLDLVAVILLCMGFSLFILYLLKRSKQDTKYVMILASLVLVYSLGKVFHLPTLIVALFFGMTLKNMHAFKMEFVTKHLIYDRFQRDIASLVQLTKEGVFVIKTFFFVILGYMIDIYKAITFVNMGIVLAVLLLIYVLRWIILLAIQPHVGGEFFIAPRGLITVLLFFSIPLGLHIPMINLEVLLLLILSGSLILPLAFVVKDHPHTK